MKFVLSRLTPVLFCFITVSNASGRGSPSYSSLCPSRTVNYITHSLPQQCLASSRGPGNTTVSEHEVNTVSSTLSEGKGDASVATDTTDQSSTLASINSTDAANHPLTTTASSPDPIEPVPTVVADVATRPSEALEDESALGTGNFLSFEEWKKQNLKKAGQSEHIARRQQAEPRQPRKRPDNSLESLGDDGEIDLDFSGFLPDEPDAPPRERLALVTDIAADDGAGGEGSHHSKPKSRSKDAGTTCKERSNYASFDCGANVLKNNIEAKNSKTVLVENKDAYMLNQCSAENKFIILELCDDILIDTVVVANFEFFSSTFRSFRVSVSDRYPVKVDKWKILGSYEARNTREVQAFLVEEPIIWARYLRIEFLTHYGNEFYCPVSLVRVHGKTMMEDYRHDLELAMEEDDENGEAEAQPSDDTLVDGLTPDAVAVALNMKTDVIEAVTSETVTDQPPAASDQVHEHDPSPSASERENHTDPASLAAIEAIISMIESTDTCLPVESPLSAHTATQSAQSSSVKEPSPALSATTPQTTAMSNSSQEASVPGTMTTSSSHAPNLQKNTTDHLSSISSTEKSTSHLASNTTSSTSGSNSMARISTGQSSGPAKSKSPTSSSSERTKSSPASQAQQATPTTQDSFFKSVQKRLQMLESNSSMSLQYIEDSSRALRDAFKKVEQRQLAKTNNFLNQLNQTVFNELREFRQQYDQLWQSTVIALEMQRERYERDNEAINARIGVLADEVIFQKRLALLQMVLILVCLMLVLFSRGAINNYLELPIVQNVLAKSHSSRWLNLSSDSLTRPQVLRTRSAHQLRTERTGILKGHHRMQSEDSIADTQSGNEIYAPLTPVSDYGQSEVELSGNDGKSPLSESEKDDSKFADPEFDPSTIERPVSSPPTLRVNDGSPISEIVTSEEELVDIKGCAKPNNAPNGGSTPQYSIEVGSPAAKHLSWNLPEG